MSDTVQVEAEPADAEPLFGAAIGVVRAYTADLAAHGVPLGLIGPSEPARIWTRHILNCGMLARVLPADCRIADVGSGAGLPGLVLAAARPDATVTLIEPMERRVRWLSEETDRLHLENVTVRRARAEEIATEDAGFDVVTARAVGALKSLLPAVSRLVRPGGELMLMKGASVEAEIEAARPQIRRLRLADVRVEMLDAGMATPGTRILRATVQ